MGDLDLPYLQAASYGPRFALPAHIRVIHSTEGPMSRGNARALAGPAWFGGPAGTSAHDIFDPGEGIKMVPDDRIAWHVGPNGNAFTRGSEHCGKVALTTDQWLSPDGREMLDRSARYNAAAAHRDGVLPRWLSLTQLARREPGFCTHNDIRLAFGGTTHSDPGPNFPYDWYMGRVRTYYSGGQPAPTPEVPDNVFELIQVDGDPRVFAVAAGFVRQCRSAEERDVLLGSPLCAGGKVRAVNARQRDVELAGLATSDRPASPGVDLAGLSAKLDEILAHFDPAATP